MKKNRLSLLHAWAIAFLAVYGPGLPLAVAQGASWQRLPEANEIEIRLTEKVPQAVKSASGLWQIHFKDSSVLQFEVEKPIERADATSRMKDKVESLKGLLQKYVDPYTGKYDRGAVCDPRQLPTERNLSAKTFEQWTLHFWATSQFVYGACRKEDAEQKSQFNLLYCAKTKSLAEVRLFYSKSAAWRKDEFVRCAR